MTGIESSRIAEDSGPERERVSTLTRGFPLGAGRDHVVAVGRVVFAAPPERRCADMVIAGKYRLVQQIGDGGMGEVWRAATSRPTPIRTTSAPAR